MVTVHGDNSGEETTLQLNVRQLELLINFFLRFLCLFSSSLLLPLHHLLSDIGAYMVKYISTKEDTLHCRNLSESHPRSKHAPVYIFNDETLMSA